MNQYYTAERAAIYKGVSYHTVSRALRRGILEHRRLGTSTLIERAVLDAWQPMTQRRPYEYKGEHARKPDVTTPPVIVGTLWLDGDMDRCGICDRWTPTDDLVWIIMQEEYVDVCPACRGEEA